MNRSSSGAIGGTVTRFPSRRYTSVAIGLHWLIAAAILTLLVSGLWMSDAIKDPAQKAFAFRVFQWHKALGLTVLVLSLARLAWRLTHTPPPLPGSMGWFQRTAAAGTHVVFYALMIGMPILGWAMVSASPIGLKTMIFGLFEWPHLPILSTLADKAPVEAALKSAHAAGGFVFLGLLALHVAAALKHHFVDRDDVLARMLPGPSTAPAGALSASRSKANGRAADTLPARSIVGRGQTSTAPQSGTAKLPPWALPAAALVLIAAVATLLTTPTPPTARVPTAATGQGAGSVVPVRKGEWLVDLAQSSIGFAGTHTGSAFKGAFKSWTAKIVFDPADLPGSSVSVAIDLASAKTGDTTYDGTLPDADWFDVAKAPRAVFDTTSIVAKGGSAYTANGRLTVRGVAVPVTLDFDLKIDGDVARMRGETRLKRLDFGIGRASDADGSWVSLDIPVAVTVVAKRQ